MIKIKIKFLGNFSKISWKSPLKSKNEALIICAAKNCGHNFISKWNEDYSCLSPYLMSKCQTVFQQNEISRSQNHTTALRRSKKYLYLRIHPSAEFCKTKIVVNFYSSPDKIVSSSGPIYNVLFWHSFSRKKNESDSKMLINLILTLDTSVPRVPFLYWAETFQLEVL